MPAASGTEQLKHRAELVRSSAEQVSRDSRPNNAGAPDANRRYTHTLRDGGKANVIGVNGALSMRSCCPRPRQITNCANDYPISSVTWILQRSGLLCTGERIAYMSCRAATRGGPSGASESRNDEDTSEHSSEQARSACSARPASPPRRAQEAGSVPLLGWYQLYCRYAATWLPACHGIIRHLPVLYDGSSTPIATGPIVAAGSTTAVTVRRSAGSRGSTTATTWLRT